MAYLNHYTIRINGISYTNGAVTPCKGARILDERLDEMVVSLRTVKADNFPPLTPVEVEIHNDMYWTSPDEIGQSQPAETIYMIVADDSATEEPPNNPYGYYDHELYLLEVTKWLERVIVDTITFTNVRDRIYTEGASEVEPIKTPW